MKQICIFRMMNFVRCCSTDENKSVNIAFLNKSKLVSRKILTTEEYEKLDKKMKGKPVVKLSSDHTGKILKEVVK